MQHKEPWRNLMLADLFSLRNRTPLVTGGSRGIVKIIAAAFLEAGARVYISSRKADQCDATASELAGRSGNCVSIPQDVSTTEGCRSLAAAYLKREPTLDILVNNAGASWLAEFDEFPERGGDAVVNLNLTSPFFLIQALVQALEAAATPDTP